MDFPESTKVVYDRIQKAEPENALQILDYLLRQENSERDMIRLAFSPDNLIHSLIKRAKIEMGLGFPSPAAVPSAPIPVPGPGHHFRFAIPFMPPPQVHPFSCPVMHGFPGGNWHPGMTTRSQSLHDFERFSGKMRLENAMQLMSLEDRGSPDGNNTLGSLDRSNDRYFPENFAHGRTGRRSPSLPDFPVKVCHYYNKGFCKNGNNCRYLHGEPYARDFSSAAEDFDEHMISPQSLEKLELEITELLKSRRGVPVSIASLPMLYYEKYGRTLQAEGYLTESQRHGKVGYSLTKLLARLKNSIHLIDRPHGQHSVILAEDVPKYIDYIGEKGDVGTLVSGSRQIYLTFPAESTFMEQDVFDYFKTFGPVQDVRIPCQQKRMFGFVTFVFPETVKQILSRASSHYICGARVLVKPYRERSRAVDRKEGGKFQQPMKCHPHCMDCESDFQLYRARENARILRKQFMQGYEHAVEFEQRRIFEMQMAPRHLTQQDYVDMERLKLLDARQEQAGQYPSTEWFNLPLDVLNPAIEDDDTRLIESYSHGRQLTLPESPFASPVKGSEDGMQEERTDQAT